MLMTGLLDYSVALKNYNEMYVRNKTKSIKVDVDTILLDFSDDMLHDFNVTMLNIMAIITLELDFCLTTETCAFGSYVDTVEGAIDAANDFYDSINGARGLLAYLVKTYSVIPNVGQLCGKSNPNWCSFDKVSVMTTYIFI